MNSAYRAPFLIVKNIKSFKAFATMVTDWKRLTKLIGRWSEFAEAIKAILQLYGYIQMARVNSFTRLVLRGKSERP